MILGVLALALNLYILAMLSCSRSVGKLKLFPLGLQSAMIIIDTGIGNIYMTTLQMIFLKSNNGNETVHETEYYFNQNLAESMRGSVIKNYNGVFCSAHIFDKLISIYGFAFCVFALAFERFATAFNPFKINKSAAIQIHSLGYFALTSCIFLLFITGSIYAGVNQGADCFRSFFENAKTRVWLNLSIFYLIPGILSIIFYTTIYQLLQTVSPVVKPLFISCLAWFIFCAPKFWYQFSDVNFLDPPYPNRSKLFYIWHNTELHETFEDVFGVLNPVIYLAFYPGFWTGVGNCLMELEKVFRNKKLEMQNGSTDHYVNEINRVSGDVKLQMRTMRTSVYQ